MIFFFFFALHDSGSYRVWSFGMSLLEWTQNMCWRRQASGSLLPFKEILVNECFVVICIFPYDWNMAQKQTNKKKESICDVIIWGVRRNLDNIRRSSCSIEGELWPAWQSQDAAEANKRDRSGSGELHLSLISKCKGGALHLTVLRLLHCWHWIPSLSIPPSTPYVRTPRLESAQSTKMCLCI